jgi:hypothetical protein
MGVAYREDFAHDINDRIEGRDGAVHAIHTSRHYKHVAFTLPEYHKLGLGLENGRRTRM